MWKGLNVTKPVKLKDGVAFTKPTQAQMAKVCPACGGWERIGDDIPCPVCVKKEKK
jgi:hypothetical protein